MSGIRYRSARASSRGGKLELTPDTDTRPLRTYGRTKARTLKPRQAALVETLLPHLAVPAEGEIDVEALFLPPPLWGRGRGGGCERRRCQAPERLHAPTPNPRPTRGRGSQCSKSASAAASISSRKPPRIPTRASSASSRSSTASPRACATSRKAASPTSACTTATRATSSRACRTPRLDLVYILFPDPWPKTRHHKRRLIQPEFLDELARVMKPGAEVRFATDWANYAAWTLEHFTRDARFTWIAERADDWREPGPATCDALRTEEARRLRADLATLVRRDAVRARDRGLRRSHCAPLQARRAATESCRRT